MPLTKTAYVSIIRVLGSIARPLGVLRFLEHRRDSNLCLFLRSLFSIYDAEDLIRLDLPWWTFGAIDHVDSVLRGRRSHVVAFEYGSGASTVWLARRCRHVYSVEHDAAWAERSRELCSHYDNVDILAIPPAPVDANTRCRSGRTGWTEYSFDRYVESIRSVPFQFDLIVIDGRCRPACLKEALAKLNNNGFIVFDNSSRRRYRDAIERTKLNRSVFRGLTPGLPIPDETTVFYAPSPTC